MNESQQYIYDRIKEKYDRLAEEEYQKLLAGTVEPEQEDPDTRVKRILRQVLLDESSLRNQEGSINILEPMSELSTAIKNQQIQKEKFSSLTLNEILKRLSNRIKDISIELSELYNNERIDKLMIIHKSEPITMVLQIVQPSKLIDILTKNDRMIYTGILFVFIAMCLYFIFGTS